MVTLKLFSYPFAYYFQKLPPKLVMLFLPCIKYGIHTHVAVFLGGMQQLFLWDYSGMATTAASYFSRSHSVCIYICKTTDMMFICQMLEPDWFYIVFDTCSITFCWCWTVVIPTRGAFLKNWRVQVEN